MRSSSSRRNQRGFTLVEMLVVIGLILFLIALLLPAARRSIEAGRQVVCLNHMRQLAQATLMYCHDNDGTFPGYAGVDPPVGPLPYEWIYWESKWTSDPRFMDPTRSPIMRYLGGHSLSGGSTAQPTQADLTVLRCPSDDLQLHMTVAHGAFGTYAFSYVMNAWTSQWPPEWLKTGYTQVNGLTYNMIPAFRLSEVKNPSQTVFFMDEDPRYVDDGMILSETFLDYPVSGGPLQGAGWSEPASYVHDTSSHSEYRDKYAPWDPNHVAGVATGQLDTSRRTNVVFCDGHGEFVTQAFLEARAHYDPKYDPTNDPGRSFMAP